MTGILIAGTSSDAGKSLMVTGICRALKRRGIDVVPFKAQNMSNNSMVCADGSEIGRAQYLQAQAAGVDPLHFGVIVILNLNIGLLTPPLGVCLFAAQRIAGCGFLPLLRATAPFVGVTLIALAIVTFWPAASLALPRSLGF